MYNRGATACGLKYFHMYSDVKVAIWSVRL